MTFSDFCGIIWKIGEYKVEKINKLQSIINNSKYIVFLGGAGTSTDCGLPDFRSETGLYSEGSKKKYKWKPEEMLSHSFYVKHPEEFF